MGPGVLRVGPQIYPHNLTQNSHGGPVTGYSPPGGLAGSLRGMRPSASVASKTGAHPQAQRKAELQMPYNSHRNPHTLPMTPVKSLQGESVYNVLLSPILQVQSLITSFLRSVFRESEGGTERHRGPSQGSEGDQAGWGPCKRQGSSHRLAKWPLQAAVAQGPECRPQKGRASPEAVVGGEQKATGRWEPALPFPWVGAGRVLSARMPGSTVLVRPGQCPGKVGSHELLGMPQVQDEDPAHLPQETGQGSTWLSVPKISWGPKWRQKRKGTEIDRDGGRRLADGGSPEMQPGTSLCAGSTHHTSISRVDFVLI